MCKLQLRLIKGITFLSSLISLGFLNSDIVQAQTAIILFQATVDGRCEFTNLVPGSLGLSSDQKTLSSEQTGGNSGSARFECNQPAKVRLEIPQEVFVSSPLTNPTHESKVFVNGNSCSTGNNPKLFTETITANDSLTVAEVEGNTGNGQWKGCHELTIDMNITSQSQISAGSYIFGVRVSATKN